MSIKPFLTILAAASVTALAGLASVPVANAMPTAAPAIQAAGSGTNVAPSSNLVEKAWYRRGPRHGPCFYHPRRCRR